MGIFGFCMLAEIIIKYKASAAWDLFGVVFVIVFLGGGGSLFYYGRLSRIKKKAQRYIGGILVFLFCVLLVGSCCISILQSGRPEIKKHQKYVDWLPVTASDISYYRKGGFGGELIYECAIPKDSFLQLAKERTWELKEVQNVKIPYIYAPLLGIESNKFDNSIKNVLFYEKRLNNGGGTKVVYDLDSNRLLFYSSNR